MKYMWAVCDVEADGKYYAYPIRISVMDNLLSKLAIKGIKVANLCESKKRAKEPKESKRNKRKDKFLLL